MNEKIRSLLEQAVREHCLAVVEEKDTDADAPEKVQQRFAELIVRECVDVIKQSDAECSNEWDFAERNLADIIKQHFGVKNP